jgi:hypothetical protein
MGLELSLTTSSGDSERCANPFCGRLIEPLANGDWRRTPRKFCSDRCKMDGYVLRRAGEMLNQVGIVEFKLVLKDFCLD